MRKSEITIRYKNNHTKVGKVLFSLNTNLGNFIVYKDDGNDEDVYAAELVDEKIIDIKNDDVKELIIKILDNFDKEV